MAGRCYGDTFEEKVVQTFDLETGKRQLGVFYNIQTSLQNW